jgi:hypothetical protein
MRNIRVLYNQDSTNLFFITREPVTPAHVDAMVDEVAGNVDVLLVNPNAQRVNYPSRVWQTFWDGYSPGDHTFFGPLPAADIPVREHGIAQMAGLAAQGCDYLARSLARCRARGVIPGVTIRMNDMHDAPTPGTHLFSDFYMAHPELHLHNGPACSWGATGLDYTHAAVRAHYLALIREVTHDYDCDVLELDFLRFQCYFPRDHFAHHCAIMTAFLREVRGVLDATGRKIALTARVAAHPAAANELGFDVATWAREGLVDGLAAGAFLATQWQTAIPAYRALVGDAVALFACADYLADRRPDLPPRALPLEPNLMRGFAAGHRAAGADGNEWFNFFCAREQAWETSPRQPSFATLAELRAPRIAGAKTYTVMSGWALPETDGVQQVPATVAQGQTCAFHFFLAADGAAEVEILFTGAAADGALWVHVNAYPAGPARVTDGHAIVTVPAEALRDGANTIHLRNEGEPITVQSLDVHVEGKLGDSSR